MKDFDSLMNAWEAVSQLCYIMPKAIDRVGDLARDNPGLQDDQDELERKLKDFVCLRDYLRKEMERAR